jgi:hypothetical protein
MTIKIEDYVLESTSSQGFDLYSISETKKGTKIGAETRSLVGYNMHFKKCLKEIVRLNMHNKLLTVTLNEFIDLYSEEVDRIEKLLEKVYGE